VTFSEPLSKWVVAVQRIESLCIDQLALLRHRRGMSDSIARDLRVLLMMKSVFKHREGDPCCLFDLIWVELEGHPIEGCSQFNHEEEHKML